MNQSQPTDAILLSTAIMLLLTVMGSAAGQQPASMPGPAARENNREMDAYDRAINLMKNDAKAAKEHRRSLFPQINEDFQRIQVVHNEIVRLIRTKELNYNRLMELTLEMKKRSNRLKLNLALPEPQQTDEAVEKFNGIEDGVFTLHDCVASFVSNPIFKNLAVVEVKSVEKASSDLDSIIHVSENIRKRAEELSKTANK